MFGGFQVGPFQPCFQQGEAVTVTIGRSKTQNWQRRERRIIDDPIDAEIADLMAAEVAPPRMVGVNMLEHQQMLDEIRRKRKKKIAAMLLIN